MFWDLIHCAYRQLPNLIAFLLISQRWISTCHTVGNTWKSPEAEAVLPCAWMPVQTVTTYSTLSHFYLCPNFFISSEDTNSSSVCFTLGWCYGWILFPPKFVHCCPNLQYFRMQLYLELGSLEKLSATNWHLPLALPSTSAVMCCAVLSHSVLSDSLWPHGL